MFQVKALGCIQHLDAYKTLLSVEV